MVAEIGLFALILSLVFALLLSSVPGIGLWRKNLALIKAAAVYARGQFLFVSLAYLCLILCFIKDDFSVIYVVANSSLSLPWFYKLCAVWGGHEGSMLLWVLILSCWLLLISFFGKQLKLALRTRILAVFGWVSSGFILFVLATSNPFIRQFQSVASHGRDLNPLLQDPGFLFHPPMLYMGYVGFSVAFAFAMASLWAGKIDIAAIRWLRPWTLAAWSCLTAGITLGSWWAYRELGWGGWWFWDPVENASFMPWLVGTALLHSLLVTEKRQQFQAWTLLLAIMTFSLSLIGTFLVRSGVLTSVHAFAIDPTRGLFILCFLLCIIGGSLILFALRGHHIAGNNNLKFFSRESALMLNNIFLTVIMLTVLLGTIYPLIIDGLGLGKLSVGAPYFNSVIVPLMIPLFFIMGLGINLHWREDNIYKIWQKLSRTGVVCVLLPTILLYCITHTIRIYALLGLILATWILLNSLHYIISISKQRGLLNIGQVSWGMLLGHLGVAITIIGISISTNYGLQKDVIMQPGAIEYLAGYTIKFLQEFQLQGANYHGVKAKFAISKHNKTVWIYPEKRIYDVAKIAMTESAIDVTAFRDIYIALGEPIDASTWSVRLYYKPFVRWIWAGGSMIFLAGILALTNKRYYFKKIKLAQA